MIVKVKNKTIFMSNNLKIENFKDRVTKFWDSFIHNEEHLQVNNTDRASYKKQADLLNSLLNEQLPKHSITFEFASNGDRELYFSPNGNWLWLMITDYIVTHAPQEVLSRWKLYSTKSSKENIADLSLDIAGTKISASDIILYPEIDKEKHKINIDFFIKGGESFPENLRYQILFILLDSSISELYTMFYIGNINAVEEKSDKDGISIGSFKVKMDGILAGEGWSSNPNPDDSFHTFELEPTQIDKFTLRDDIYMIVSKNAGIEVYKNFIGVEAANNDAYFSTFKDSGIFFKSIFYDFESIPAEEVIDLRDKILEEMTLRINSQGIAKWISSATAVSHTYIDFIVYDLDVYTEIVKDIASKYNLPIIGLVDFNKEEEPLYL